MTPEVFAWSPWVALAAGAVAAGLGALRSLAWAFGLSVAALFLQVAAWTVLLTVAAQEAVGPGRWDVDCAAAFLLTLTVVAPYTTIGAVVGGVVGRLTRRLIRKRWRTEWGRDPGPG